MSDDNLLLNVEQSLKKNINIILSQDKDLRNTDNECLITSLSEFEQSILKLKTFFIKAKLINDQLNPKHCEKEEIEEMKTELARKDLLIQQQQKKLSSYQNQLEIIKDAQEQAKLMN